VQSGVARDVRDQREGQLGLGVGSRLEHKLAKEFQLSEVGTLDKFAEEGGAIRKDDNHEFPEVFLGNLVEGQLVFHDHFDHPPGVEGEGLHGFEVAHVEGALVGGEGVTGLQAVHGLQVSEGAQVGVAVFVLPDVLDDQHQLLVEVLG
jgi:hypothetical protein